MCPENQISFRLLFLYKVTPLLKRLFQIIKPVDNQHEVGLAHPNPLLSMKSLHLLLHLGADPDPVPPDRHWHSGLVSVSVSPLTCYSSRI